MDLPLSRAQDDSKNARDSPAEPSALSAAPSTSSAGSQPATSPKIAPSSSGSNKAAHRQSFAENMRSVPPSPRHRHPSLTHAAVQELVNYPPPGNRQASYNFANRDWRDITLGELVSPEDVDWVELDSSVEEASKILLRSRVNVVLIRESADSRNAISTFDYNDLNAYLLVIIGLARPEDDQVQQYQNIIAKAKDGARIPLRDIQSLCRRDPLINIPSSDKLYQAIEIMGSGIHQLMVTNTSGDVIGILNQLRVVYFFWTEGVNFPTVNRLYPSLLRDLGIGTQEIISVNWDAPLSDALILMHDEGVTSVAVIDNNQNVVGNISSKDVRHLTTTSSAHLLSESCMHFISVILNERGVEEGQDTFPVFYVYPSSTLAHTVAKLVATKSHRMWIVDSASPSSSSPVTPLMAPQGNAGSAPPGSAPAGAVPSLASTGSCVSGKLSGVVSLTDVLNTFAKSTGLRPADPGEQRARRRRSSSSSMRPSLESSRASLENWR